MSTRIRIGKMLIGAAVIVPALAVAILIVESRLLLLHFQQRDIVRWLIADAAVLALGLMLNRGEDL